MIKADSKISNSSNQEIGNDLLTVNSQLLCPIYQQIMLDPVVIQTGQVFQRQAIQAWFKRGKKTNPLTNLPLNTLALFPCISLRNVIQKLPTQILAMKKAMRKQKKQLQQLLIAIQNMWNQSTPVQLIVKQQKKVIDQQNQKLKKQIQQKELQNEQIKKKCKQLQIKAQENIGLMRQASNLKDRFMKAKNNLALAQQQTQKLKIRLNQHRRSESKFKLKQKSMEKRIKQLQEQKKRLITRPPSPRYQTPNRKRTQHNFDSQSKFSYPTGFKNINQQYQINNVNRQYKSKTTQSYSIYGQCIAQRVKKQKQQYQKNKNKVDQINKQMKINNLKNVKQTNVFSKNKKQAPKITQKEKQKEVEIPKQLNQRFYIPYTSSNYRLNTEYQERKNQQKNNTNISSNNINYDNNYNNKNNYNNNNNNNNSNYKQNKPVHGLNVTTKKVDKNNPQQKQKIGKIKKQQSFKKQKQQINQQPLKAGVKNTYKIQSYNKTIDTKAYARKLYN